MWCADRSATPTRHQGDVTWKDTLIIGLAQCLALVPGVSRSGATMSAGLLRDLDRGTVTRLSFFLSIPALLAASALQTAQRYDDISHGVGWTATLTATAGSFLVAYATSTPLPAPLTGPAAPVRTQRPPRGPEEEGLPRSPSWPKACQDVEDRLCRLSPDPPVRF